MGSSAFTAYQNGAANATGNSGIGVHTVTAMGRWSVLNKQLPPTDHIRAIHVYDFDNTLFKTPLPNPKLWNGPTIGMLSNPDAFVNGGWWHDSRILAATGEGIAKEEPRAWEGWWNEKIVELIHLSNKQKDALCVLLTGRSESGFGELIKRMAASRGLDFDLISLKPAVGPNNERFANTMVFKQAFLHALMQTYKQAKEMRIYEDRIKHVKGFRDFLDGYDDINGEVIQVLDVATYLDPIVEVAEVQQIITDHNASLTKRRRGVKGDRLAINKTVFYTGYMISNTDTQRLLTLAQTPQNLPEGDLKFHANNIMICPRPCPPAILEKVGGLGSKMTWEVTGTASFENTIWAVCVKPVPATASFHTGDPVPLVVLALRKGARHIDAGKIQKWQPVSPDKAFRFETTVGEKILLRIEGEAGSQHHGHHGTQGHHHDGQFHKGQNNKRKHTGGQDDFRARQSGGAQGGQQPQRQFHQGRNFADGGGTGGPGNGGGGGGGRGGAAGRGNARGGGGGGGNRGFRNSRGGGKGRGGGRGGHGGGGNHHYKSLDDVGGRDNTHGGFAQMYEDEPHARFQNQNIPKGPANPANPGFYPGANGQQQSGKPSGGAGGGGGMELNNFY
ncbi:uncharacterized protein C8A04DRAFT_9588 [Dichotomopilus funicola]|uniref:Swiss Army Knife RNA repair protein HAD domain-containing protein n=1 Tax=Dichotomopilus funicola TaxID=1934379 RepID=A0AAN6V906_9PEZI|nr:hypothetical protein C8A04DRAFT_9588 [Dichotomopilus funicola]